MEFSKPGFVATGRSTSPGQPATRARSRLQVGARYSALIARVAERPLPESLRRFAYAAFARAVGANLDEVERPLHEYESLGEFFTRKLREGARSVDDQRGTVVSPCDGVVAAVGHAVDGALLQAKGRHYRLEELLADEAFAHALQGGPYTTIYLSPRDYHRVHTPVAAHVTSVDYIPGALWPVNPRLANRKDNLLARNERVVIRLSSEEIGDFAVVMVGAAGVGNIKLIDALGVETATLRHAGERYRKELAHGSSGVAVQRGDELGAFRLGSTVVMVFAPGTVSLEELTVGRVVQFGEAIGMSLTERGGRA